jgi:hypothetical protein
MMRFTIVGQTDTDQTETISFVGPPHGLKALAACCAQGTTAISEILIRLGFYDIDLSRRVREQLSVFREHNTEDDSTWIEEKIASDADYELPIVVLSESTRRLSLQPGKLGMIVFNLPARRIVQVQNSYANLERSDRGRVRRDGKPTTTFYNYALPAEWTIVP